MKTITAIAANKLGNFLARDFRRIFGSACDDWAERIGSAARSTIECLAMSDALYHNYEHTLQVTMVGRDILHGMMVHQRLEAEDYGHLIAACLMHDIGYVRGALSGDTETEFVIDAEGWEFEEIGTNRQLGYSSPADIVERYPAFFWDSVSMHLDDGIKYLNMTASGRQWIANLHHHVLCAERAQRLMGPQI